MWQKEKEKMNLISFQLKKNEKLQKLFDKKVF